jgi:hypothetical protein
MLLSKVAPLDFTKFPNFYFRRIAFRVRVQKAREKSSKGNKSTRANKNVHKQFREQQKHAKFGVLVRELFCAC